MTKMFNRLTSRKTKLAVTVNTSDCNSSTLGGHPKGGVCHIPANTMNKHCPILELATEPSHVLISGEDWLKFSSKNSCAVDFETPEDQIVSVKTFKFKAFLYACFSSSSNAFTGDYTLEGWKLVPLAAFNGPTYKRMNWEELEKQGHKRGNLCGKLVKVRGQIMVCTSPVTFKSDLPTTPPIGIEEAKEYDARNRRWGWRSISYGAQAQVEWMTLKGHPVVSYDANGQPRAILIWKDDGHYHEYGLGTGKEINFDSPDAMFIPAQMSAQSFGQASLF